MDRRWGPWAGIGFVLAGVVELALTGGPTPGPLSPTEEFRAYFASTAAVGPVVGVLSALAGLMMLVFAWSLVQDADGFRGRHLIGLGGTLTVALAWVGQTLQQRLWHTAAAGALDPALPLAPLVGHAFSYALMGGALMAGTLAVATLAEEAPFPAWTAVLGFLAGLVALVGVAVPAVGGAGFPVFLVWLLAVAVVQLRRSPERAAV